MSSNESCPACSKDSTRLFETHGYWVRECNTCTHRFAELQPDEQHVKQVYDDAYFVGGQAGYVDYLGEREIIRERGTWYADHLSRNAELKPGRILDVGCASGAFLEPWIERGFKPTGIEPNPRMAEHARETLACTIHTGPLETLPTKDSFDLISMVQVISHFYDLRRALESARALTAPGGYWLIETWNRTSLTAKLYGRHWHEYSPPSVLHWFTPDNLERLAKDFGMSLVATGRPKRRITGSHAKSLIGYKVEQLPLGRILRAALSIIPDRLSVPYPGNDLFWSLFKENGEQEAPRSEHRQQ